MALFSVYTLPAGSRQSLILAGRTHSGGGLRSTKENPQESVCGVEAHLAPLGKKTTPVGIPFALVSWTVDPGIIRLLPPMFNVFYTKTMLMLVSYLRPMEHSFW